MSLLHNEEEPVLYPWSRGYSQFLLGAKPLQLGAPPGAADTRPPLLTQLAESSQSSPSLLWIGGVVVFVLVILVLLRASR